MTTAVLSLGGKGEMPGSSFPLAAILLLRAAQLSDRCPFLVFDGRSGRSRKCDCWFLVLSQVDRTVQGGDRHHDVCGSVSGIEVYELATASTEYPGVSYR